MIDYYKKPIFRGNYKMNAWLFELGNYTTLNYCHINKKWLVFKEEMEIGEYIW